MIFERFVGLQLNRTHIQPTNSSFFSRPIQFAGLEKADAIEQYLTFGGMPLAVLEPKENEKRKYLTDLHKNVYIKDIVERYKLKDDVVIDALTHAIYSTIGSLFNPHKLTHTIKTVMSLETTDPTIKSYLGYLEDAYLVSVAERYDIKGKQYFENIKKYYAMDWGASQCTPRFPSAKAFTFDGEFDFQ